MVSGFTFRSLIHFEFIFVYGIRKCSSFFLLQVVDQFSLKGVEKYRVLYKHKGNYLSNMSMAGA